MNKIERLQNELLILNKQIDNLQSTVDFQLQELHNWFSDTVFKILFGNETLPEGFEYEVNNRSFVIYPEGSNQFYEVFTIDFHNYWTEDSRFNTNKIELQGSSSRISNGLPDERLGGMNYWNLLGFISKFGVTVNENKDYLCRKLSQVKKIYNYKQDIVCGILALSKDNRSNIKKEISELRIANLFEKAQLDWIPFIPKEYKFHKFDLGQGIGNWIYGHSWRIVKENPKTVNIEYRCEYINDSDDKVFSTYTRERIKKTILTGYFKRYIEYDIEV